MVTAYALRLSPLLVLAAAACQTAGSPVPAPEGPSFRGEEVQPDEFTLVFLRTGIQPPELSESESSAAFEGHFEFMGRLAAEGTLLVAGPFGNTKATNDLRGLFVLDAASFEAAVAAAAEDPTTELGVFRQEAFSMIASDSIRHLPEMHAEFEAARAAEAADLSVPVLADYVVMVAPDGKAAFLACTHEALEPKVVMLGRLGEPRDGALFGVFDAADPEEIRARLTVAGYDAGEVELSQWLASPILRSLVPRDGH